MPDFKQLPNIAETERSAFVERLLGQAEVILQVRDEIAVLKGQKAKPKLKPSGMEAEQVRTP